MGNRRYGDWLLNFGTIALTLCALVIGGFRIRDEIAARSAPQDATRKTREISDWRQYSSVGHRVGPANAPVTMVEFLDFQCPYCRVASGSIHDLQRWYGKDLAVVYRHFPLPFHQYARPAAIASECAARVGKYQAIHDLFFAQADSLGSKNWARFALDAGISDTVRFNGCMKDGSVLAILRRDSVAADALGLTATPTFVINDLVVSGNVGFEQMNNYIKDALDEAKN